MAYVADWQKLASALRELHRALMERARRDYERDHLQALSPGELLQLLPRDPYFDWLRALSEVLVDIDLIRDAASLDEFAGAGRPAVEHLISASDATEAVGSFAEHYWPYVQDDPHVAMAHAGVKHALASWPPPADADAATLLHHRHLLAEKARHRSR